MSEIAKAGKKKRLEEEQKQEKKKGGKKKHIENEQTTKVKDRGTRNFKKDLKAWERNHIDSPKGTSWFWNTSIQVTKHLLTTIYLTVVQDGKICWRLDNFLGGLRTKMHFWDYEHKGKSDVKVKKWVTNMCATVHHVFRNHMGPVDQSDVKSDVMGICHEYTSHWYEKQLAFLVETAVGNAFANYNLDRGIDKRESFTEFYDLLTRDLLEASPDFRLYKTPKKRKLHGEEVEVSNGDSKRVKRSHKAKSPVVHYRISKTRALGTPTEKGLLCPARKNLLGALRFDPKEWKISSKGQHPIARRIICTFCGYKTTTFRCAGCDQAFCMRPPVNLFDPDSNPPRRFRRDGLLCWQRLHGYKNFSDLPDYFEK